MPCLVCVFHKVCNFRLLGSTDFMQFVYFSVALYDTWKSIAISYQSLYQMNYYSAINYGCLGCDLNKKYSYYTIYITKFYAIWYPNLLVLPRRKPHLIQNVTIYLCIHNLLLGFELPCWMSCSVVILFHFLWNSSRVYSSNLSRKILI